MFSSWFFYARSISNIFIILYFFGDIEKVPLDLLVKWEVVSPNSRYREFYHEVKWKVVSPDSRLGQWEYIFNIYKNKFVVLASEPVGGRSRREISGDRVALFM